MPATWEKRVGPDGFENCSRIVTETPQKEMQSTQPYQLSLNNQSSTQQPTGKMDTAPKPVN